MSKSARLRKARQANHRLEFRAHEVAAEEGRQRGCLVCRESNGGFSSVEHILPESLGNTELLLPIGVVCDRCNHGPLSRVDQALAGFLPIEMMRTWHGIPAKSGGLPVLEFDNGTMETRAPGHVHLFLKSSRGQPPKTAAPPGYKSHSFSAQRMKDATPRRLRGVQTALLKMVMEFAWIDLGEREALSGKFDHVREKILAQAHAGYLVFPERATTDEKIEVQYEERQRVGDGHPLYGVVAKFWGLPIFTDSLFDEPTAEIPEGWILQRFAAASSNYRG